MARLHWSSLFCLLAVPALAACAGQDHAPPPPAETGGVAPAGTVSDAQQPSEPKDVTAETVEARLDRLERGLAELQIDYSRLAPLLAAPPAQAQTQAATRVYERKGGAQNVTAVTPASDQFALHLASYRDEALAGPGWDDLVSRFPESLSPLTPVVAAVEVENRGIFHRLKAGPFPSWHRAESACAPLRENGLNCTVMDFSGARLTDGGVSTQLSVP